VPVKSRAPKELTSTAYYFADATILSKIAAILGHEDDQKKYTALADTKSRRLSTTNIWMRRPESMAAVCKQNCVYRFSGIWCLQQFITKVAGNLAKKVEDDGFHIDVGLLGSKAILNALSENGYADVAYKVASQETYPSWGWWIVNGATTFFENWDLEAKRDLSLNHIMFGEINAWLYKALGGIKPDPDQPGFKNVLLQPHFVDGLEHFYAEHDGPFGKIVSSWKKENSQVIYTVKIPANSSATVLLKGQNILLNDDQVERNKNAAIIHDGPDSKIQLNSGNYEFRISL
jgi:alpha-L-rhamnosidase